MRVLAGLVGFALLATVLVDAFLTVIVARRAQRIFHLANYFYRVTWAPCAALARRVKSGRRREDLLSFYGPLSLLFLLVFWASTLVVAFALLQWSAGLTQGTSRAGMALDL
jgi:hypothetical protein